MKAGKSAPATIDAYIAGFPADTQEILKKVRATIRKAAPKAGEKISYGIPTFTMNGAYLIYFAGYKAHIGIYPVPRGDPALDKAVAPYIAGKGTVRLPLDEPIPYGLITKMVKFKLKENKAKAATKGKR